MPFLGLLACKRVARISAWCLTLWQWLQDGLGKDLELLYVGCLQVDVPIQEQEVRIHACQEATCLQQSAGKTQENPNSSSLGSCFVWAPVCMFDLQWAS